MGQESERFAARGTPEEGRATVNLKAEQKKLSYLARKAERTQKQSDIEAVLTQRDFVRALKRGEQP